MRKLGTALLGLVLAATGVYFVLYLYGWEWYRAFVVGIVFLGAEMALVSIHLGRALERAAAQAPGPLMADAVPGARSDSQGHEVVARVLDATPPSHPDPFRWLRPQTGQTSVFIPLLLGAGVLMSGVAWVMERLATSVYGSRIDASLARMAAPLVPPTDLLDRPTEPDLLGTPGSWEHIAGREWDGLAMSDGGR